MIFTKLPSMAPTEPHHSGWAINDGTREDIAETDVSAKTDPSSSLIEERGESALQEDYNTVARYVLDSFKMKRHDQLEEIIAFYTYIDDDESEEDEYESETEEEDEGDGS